LLTREFRQARRATDYFGMKRWDRMVNLKPITTIDGGIVEEGEWRLFLRALWHYQWTKKEAPLDEDMINTMYEYSQGITDIAVKLFMVAQWRAIASGTELITAPLIADVAKNELKAVYPVIQAFRLNNFKVLESAIDVFQKDFEVETHFGNVLSELAKKLKQNDGRATTVVISSSELASEAVQWLKEAGTPSEIAEAIVKKVQATHENLLLSELKRMSFQLLSDTKQKVEKTRSYRQRSNKKPKKKAETQRSVPDLTGDVLTQGEI
jgi:hypothetical protein